MVLPESDVTISPGRCALLPGIFSTAGMKRGHRDRRLQLRDARAWRRCMAAPPAMSYFIFSMPSAGLMEMPPVSKVTPLPTRPRWSDPVRALRPVLQDDQSRRLSAALRYAEKRAHAELPHAILIQHFALEPSFRGHLARTIRETERGQRLAGSFTSSRVKFCESPITFPSWSTRSSSRLVVSTATSKVSTRFSFFFGSVFK